MKQIILFLILLTLKYSISAQTLIQNINSYSPPSPEAASLANQAAKYSIDHYTGRLSYYAPLYKLNMDGIDIDLGLQYSSSGFKVQDVASSVGLGWNTTHAGVITRYVEGLPDEDANGYCGANQIGQKAYSTPTQDYFKKTTAGDWDSQPDKFIFSFQGFSGTFKLDVNGLPVLESGMTGLKILYSPFNRSNGRNNGGAENWIIIDQLGNTYLFGEDATERTESTYHEESTTKTKSYVSSWYIRRITNANQKSIEYLYETGPELSYTYFLNARRSTIVQGTCSLNGVSNIDYNENVDIKISLPLYLSSIRTADAETSVRFIYTNGREDLSGGRSLRHITILNNSVIKKRFVFNYAYFMENSNSASKRLKLSSIQEVNPVNNIVKELYGFYYNESMNLPPRNSIKTDYWGYYNDNQGSSNIEGYLGANKQPSFEHAAANVLTKIKNVTGGFLNFEFEQNNYLNGNSNIPAGGIRIKKIYETQSTLSNAPKINEEEYIYQKIGTSSSSGQVYINQSNAQLRMDYLLIWQFGVCVITQAYKYSEPLISILDLNSSSVGYSTVTVKKLNGTVRYRFTNYQDKPDIFDERKFDPLGSADAPNSSNYNLAPQLPATSSAKFRGKVLSEEQFDSNGQKVKGTAYGYLTTLQSPTIVGVKAFPIAVVQGNGNTTFSYVRYNFATQDLRLSSRSDTTFNNNVQISSSLEDYTYSPFADNLIQKRVTSLPRRTMTETYRYPCDIQNVGGTISNPSKAPIEFLKAKNIIGTPLESIQSYTDYGQIEKVVSAQLIKYKAINNEVVLPWKEYALELNAPLPINQFTFFRTNTISGYESDINDVRYNERSVNKYNTHGNIVEKLAAQDTSRRQSYIWGQNGKHLIAEIANASSAECYYENFEGSDKNQAGYLELTTSKKHTGDQSVVVTNNTMTLMQDWMYTSKMNNPAGRTFTVSGWVYLTGSSAAIKLILGSNVNTVYEDLSTTEANRWVYLEKKVFVSNDVVIMNLALESLNGTCFFDDLKIYPSDANMTTYTFRPLVGMTSKTNLQDQTTFYEYDEFNRLKSVKDNQGNIIKMYNYHYKQ